MNSKPKHSDRCYLCKKEVPSDSLVLIKDGSGSTGQRCFFVCPHHHGVWKELQKGNVMKQLSQEEAIALAESEFWKEMSDREIAEFQMFQDKLCVPFNVFHKAIEKALGRPVYTHEFGLNWEGLQKELRGEKPAPTFEEIVNLIPEEKRVIIIT